MEGDIADAFRIFQQLDQNGDGTVSKKEMSAAMAKNKKMLKALGLSTFKDARELVGTADKDDSGDMSFDEFVDHLLVAGIVLKPTSHEATKMEDSTVTRIFKKIDKDDSGKLDKGELKAAYATILLTNGENPTSRRITRWATRALSNYDADDDGGLDLEEFRKLCQNTEVLVGYD
jgi:Ca2+-binding EF-hand superfamily protein